MELIKKIAVIVLKSLLVIVLLLVIVIGGLLIWHFATIESPDNYLPRDFLVYLKVDSIKAIYDNLIDLRATDVFFSSSADLKSVYSALLEFKANELTKNWLFSQLLKVRTDVVITGDFTPVLVFDPGIISIPTRLIPVLNILVQIEGVNYSIIKKGKITLYAYQTGSSNLYFSFHNNLIFFSTKEEAIIGLYNNSGNQTSLKYNTDLAPVKAKVKTGGFAEVYLNSAGIITAVAKDNADLRNLVKEIQFGSLCALSFKVSNQDIFISAYTNLKTANPLIGNFLSYKPAGLQVLKYIPASANLYTTVNFKSFREILDIILYFKGKELAKTIEDIDNGSKLLFGIGIDKLLFDWIGSEVGLFSTAENAAPVIFVKIGSQDKWKLAWDKIMRSIFFNEDSSLVLDNILVKKITFPPFLNSLVNLFVKGMETPYFIELGDFAFFSMSAEVLAQVANNYREGKLLIHNQVYKAQSQDIPQDANLFLYYDLNTKLPPFLASRTLLSDLLLLYEKGLLAVHFNESEVRIDIAAVGIAGDKTAAFPGYPVKLTREAAGDIVCTGLETKRKYKFAYISRDNQLIIRDVIDGSIIENNVEKNSSLLISNNTLTGKNEIFVFSQAGTLYKFDTAGNAVPPFPRVTEFKNSFPPADIDNELVFYSETDKSLYFMEKDSARIHKFNFVFSKNLLTPPAFNSRLLVFYPKSISGEVFLTDLEGSIMTGWPVFGGGISFCAPFFAKQGAENLVVFLSQAGILNLWHENGTPVTGFPVDLEGIYYQNPVIVSANIAAALARQPEDKAILVLSGEGVLTLVSFTGEILKQKSMDELKGRENRIELFDFDKDTVEEVFIYGATNYVTGLGRDLDLLPGFPVKGSMQPSFVDLNFDGLYEMVVGSFDGNAYGYTLNK